MMSDQSKWDKRITQLKAHGFSVGEATHYNPGGWHDVPAVIYPDGLVDDMDDDTWEYLDLQQQWERAWRKYKSGILTGERNPDIP